MEIMIRKGQQVSIEDDNGVLLEGFCLKDLTEEDNDLHMLDKEWSCGLKVRIDLAVSLVVDGVEIIDQF